MPAQPRSIVAEIVMHAVDLRHDEPRVLQQGVPSRCDTHTPPLACQQGHAQRIFHASDALACRSQGHMAGLRASRDGASIMNVQEKAQVREIESHGSEGRLQRRIR